MSGGWVGAVLVAALAQTGRNAAQSRLTRAIGTVGATQVRFLFGLPFAILFLTLVGFATGEALPVLTLRSVAFTVLGALAQIGATALMLRVMQARSFALTTAWLKTEPVIVALAAALVLHDPLSWPMLLAVLVATAGVIVTSFRSSAVSGLRAGAGPVIAGLLAAGLFGASAIGFRGGIIALPSGGFLIRASTILVLSLTLQSLILMVWMGLFDRAALAGSFRVWRGSLGAGFLGAFASQFWFIGFALTSAANVRTLALVEVIFAQAAAYWLFGQKADGRQIAGMAVIMLGVGMLLRLQA